MHKKGTKLIIKDHQNWALAQLFPRLEKLEFGDRRWDRRWGRRPPKIFHILLYSTHVKARAPLFPLLEKLESHCVSLNGGWIFRTNSGTVPGSSPSLALFLSIQTSSQSQMIRGKQLEIMHLSLLSPNIGLRSVMLLSHPGPSYAQVGDLG